MKIALVFILVLKLDSEASIDLSCLSQGDAQAFAEVAIVTYEWLVVNDLSTEEFVSIKWSPKTVLSSLDLSSKTRVNTRSLVLKSLTLKERSKYMDYAFRKFFFFGSQFL